MVEVSGRVQQLHIASIAWQKTSLREGLNKSTSKAAGSTPHANQRETPSPRRDFRLDRSLQAAFGRASPIIAIRFLRHPQIGLREQRHHVGGVLGQFSDIPTLSKFDEMHLGEEIAQRLIAF